jgi:hypothetical protein
MKNLGTETFLLVAELVKKFISFNGTRRSVTEQASDPYPEPVKPSPHPYMLFLL